MANSAFVLPLPIEVSYLHLLTAPCMGCHGLCTNSGRSHVLHSPLCRLISAGIHISSQLFIVIRSCRSHLALRLLRGEIIPCSVMDVDLPATNPAPWLGLVDVLVMKFENV
jgi:hypothetical protein